MARGRNGVEGRFERREVQTSDVRSGTIRYLNAPHIEVSSQIALRSPGQHTQVIAIIPKEKDLLAVCASKPNPMTIFGPIDVRIAHV